MNVLLKSCNKSLALILFKEIVLCAKVILWKPIVYVDRDFTLILKKTRLGISIQSFLREERFAAYGKFV